MVSTSGNRLKPASPQVATGNSIPSIENLDKLPYNFCKPARYPGALWVNRQVWFEDHLYNSIVNK